MPPYFLDDMKRTRFHPKAGGRKRVLYRTDILLSRTGQNHLGAFQLVDQLDPHVGIGLYGGAVLTAFKEALTNGFIHSEFLLIV